MSFQEFVDYDTTWKMINGVEKPVDDFTDNELKELGVEGF